jgi:hypothetical protein
MRCVNDWERSRMSEPATAVRLALSGNVLHETIDGEVIVIDLKTGTYYSLRGTAADVWGLLQRSPGMTAGELSAVLVSHWDCNGHDVEASVATFVAQLRDEGLVNVVESAPTGVVATAADSSDGSRGAFAAPMLDKYTDMQDLVLIDPVHDVSEAGWPHLPPQAAADGARA